MKNDFTNNCWTISYTIGFVSRKRPFSTEAQIGLSYTIEKWPFRLNLFGLRILTGGSSRKSRVIRLDPPAEKLSRERFTRVLLTDRIDHPTAKHTPTRPRGHAPYQVPHCSIIQGADAGLAIPAVASRSKSVWRIPSSARQQRVNRCSL